MLFVKKNADFCHAGQCDYDYYVTDVSFASSTTPSTPDVAVKRAVKALLLVARFEVVTSPQHTAIVHEKNKKKIIQKKIMDDGGKSAMSQYCKAQAQINKITRESEEARRQLNERIRTYRSILHDELSQRQLSCVELQVADKDPVYLRLKKTNNVMPIDPSAVIEMLQRINNATLNPVAEKHGHDLPKMVTSLLTQEIKKKQLKKDKNTLSISNTKERGYERTMQETIPQQVRQVATDLIAAQDQLSKLRQRQSVSKKPIVEEQKAVEEKVKETLKAADPVSMTTRVHMLQDGDEWVYFLRCKEKETVPTIGMKRIMPMLESAITDVLRDHGLGREYNSTFLLTSEFWSKVCTVLEQSIDAVKREVKVTSRISLDRGAPRAGRKMMKSDVAPTGA